MIPLRYSMRNNTWSAKNFSIKSVASREAKCSCPGQTNLWEFHYFLRIRFKMPEKRNFGLILLGTIGKIITGSWTGKFSESIRRLFL